MYIYSTERLGSTYAAMSFWMSFCNKKKIIAGDCEQHGMAE